MDSRIPLLLARLESFDVVGDGLDPIRKSTDGVTLGRESDLRESRIVFLHLLQAHRRDFFERLCAGEGFERG